MIVVAKFGSMNLAEHEGLGAMLISSACPTFLGSGRVSQLDLQLIIKGKKFNQ